MKTDRDTIASVTADLKKYLISEKESGQRDMYFQKKSGPAGGIAQPAAHQDGPGGAALRQFNEEIKDCKKCGLHKTRTKFVFGEGNPRAQLVFVGEAPGRDEDQQGRPFVGRAGQLLTKIIEAMGYKREDVFICNVLKCRPPNNRAPEPGEVEQCEPHLLEQLRLIGPKAICALGTHAAHTLLKTDTPISAMRGNFYDYHGIKLMPTYHPAYLLRNPAEKRKVWEDVQKIRDYLKK
jgi:DNA polymerase